MRIWHRNYYEVIVWSHKQRAAIEKYIRMNPVRLVWEGAHEECEYRAFGNPALWDLKMAGVLASGSGMPTKIPELKPGWAWISGFHSGQEEAVLAAHDVPCIRVTAVAPEHVILSEVQLQRLAAGRLLVVCPFETSCTTRENALTRNRLVSQWCDRLWIPAARTGGSLEKLSQEFDRKRYSPQDPAS